MKLYTIATTKALHDINTENESELQSFYDEQNTLADLETEKNYIIKISDNNNKSRFTLHIGTLDELIQSIPVKDGVDIVTTNNKLSIVAYYNNLETMVEFKELTESEYSTLEEMEETTPYYNNEVLTIEFKKYFN